LPNQNWLNQHNPNHPIGWPMLRIELTFRRKGKDASPFGLARSIIYWPIAFATYSGLAMIGGLTSFGMGH
jgi:hypothetical protein